MDQHVLKRYLGPLWFVLALLPLMVAACSQVVPLPYSSNPATIEEILPYTSVNQSGLNLKRIEIGLVAPTRIKISASGSIMLIAELDGRVWIYQKVEGEWVKQTNPFYQLEDLGGGLEVQKGLAGLFFGANFSETDPDPQNREIFLTYAVFDGGVFRNRILRLTLNWQDGEALGTDPQTIYESPEPPGGNHQIQDGLGLSYEGSPHILVALGDAHAPEEALDEGIEGRGKILLLQRDGSDPLGPRPFTNPRLQAIGARNPYGMVMLPTAIDPKRRILGVEPGNKNSDRIWLLELIDFGHETDAPVSLGYSGSDEDLSWTQILDPNNPGPPALDGVVALLEPTVTPTSISLHPGKGWIPAPSNQDISFITVNFGVDEPGVYLGRSLVMGTIQDLEGQPWVPELTPIVERSPAYLEEPGNPLAMDVDPATGDIVFSDLITGELFQITIQD